MAFPDVHEDAATFAAEALLKLIQDYKINPKEISKNLSRNRICARCCKTYRYLCHANGRKRARKRIGARCFNVIALNGAPAPIACSCSWSPTRTIFAPRASASPTKRASSAAPDHAGLVDHEHVAAADEPGGGSSQPRDHDARVRLWMPEAFLQALGRPCPTGPRRGPDSPRPPMPRARPRARWTCQRRHNRQRPRSAPAR